MVTHKLQADQMINTQFPVVGIGTTASEIDALKEVLANLHTDSGMAFLIFEDLASEQHKNLFDLLTEHATIPIHEIVNTIELHPNHIYIIPHNNFLIVESGILKLKPYTRNSKVTNCLDSFFAALSKKYESHAIGLLLSWSPLDGNSGLKKIKELGGASVSAITKAGFSLNKSASEFIDYFTTPTETASILLKIKNSYLINQAYEEKEITVNEESFFNNIINLIVLKTGTNFHNYKSQTLRRRIAKRMVITQQETVEKYLNLLKNNPLEQDLLFNDILIPVTYFFRDEPFFDSLSTIVFPALIESLSGTQLRIWSAGCSSGEEVYSIAICVDEYLQRTNNNDITVKVFASDLSLKCIEKARAGFYTLQDLKNIDKKRIAQYFIKKDNGYLVNKIIRDNCIFTVHDLTEDFPFSKIDLILCRNVLIYFNTELQNQVLASFHYALREKGFLFLGKSESAYNVPNLFEAVEKNVKIYRRKNIDSRFDSTILPTNGTHFQNKRKENTTVAGNDFRKIVSDILLEHYSPAAVLIKKDFEIVHFHGNTSPFLQPPAGKPSFNIINMVHHELRFALRNAILKTRNEKKNFEAENIAVKNQPFLTSFEAVYIPSHAELLLIIFCRKPIPTNNEAGSKQVKDNEDNEKELLLLHDNFKHLNDEQQIYFEELQTTNEELLRRTEELQMLNEQLEISAEELRSNNEELFCTNDELHDRRNELSSMRNFYESIVKTIKEPLLIIDKNFIVYSANPSFYSCFTTKEEHIEGFSISDLGHSHWNTPEFKETVLKKINRNEKVENVKIQFNLNSARKKTMLVTATMIDSLPKGMILIAFEDITNLELSNESLRIKNAELHKHKKQLETFTVAASDNLLNPIRKIYMFGKKIIDTETSLTETGKHNLKRLLSVATNLSQLLEDLIIYSKINFEEKKFKKTDLNLLLKKVINDLKPLVNEHNAIIETETLPSMNIIPCQIHMLFTHLISNAIKYAKHETIPQIKIGMQLPNPDEFIIMGADPDTEYIKLFVSDNGIGFHKDFEKLIFNPFYKLQNNDERYGTGLGLAVVQQIVVNHKAFIKASSSPGEGTSIYVYFPLEVSFADKYSRN